MKNVNSFLRWGIPGWTVAIGFLIFVLGDYVSANDNTMYQLISRTLSSGGGIWQTLIAGILVAGTGIPLGFIIYQVYFYLRWTSPISRDGLFPPLIVGRVQELEQTQRDLDEKTLSLRTVWRENMLSSSESHRTSWHYLSPLLREAFVALDSSGTLRDRHTYLMSTLHSLGASLLGLSFGFAAYLLTKWRLGQSELWWSVVALVIILITVVLLSAEERHQQKPLRLLGMVASHPAELFLGSVIYLYVALNPALNAILPLELPIVLCVSFGLLWGWSTRDSREIVWGLTTVLLIVTLAIRMLVIGFLEYLNWPVLFSIIVYSCLSLALLKNRENARDALVAMEYYHLRRYIGEQDIERRVVRSSGVCITYINYNPPGNDVKGEYVEIENRGKSAVDMTSWTLHDEAGNTYKFPAFVLKAKTIVRVWTRHGTDTSTDLYWGRELAAWNNAGDRACLRDSEGTEVDSYLCTG